MSRAHKWPMGLIGYARADVEGTLQSTEKAYAVQIDQVEAELSEAASHVAELTTMVSRQRERIGQLLTTISNLESTRRRTEATLPLLGDLAERRIRELEHQAERDRAALRDEIGRAEQELAREQADFRLLLERVQALAMSMLPNGETERQPTPTAFMPPGRVVPMRVIKEPLAALTKEGPVAPGAGWRPGMIRLDAPPVPSSDLNQPTADEPEAEETAATEVAPRQAEATDEVAPVEAGVVDEAAPVEAGVVDEAAPVEAGVVDEVAAASATASSDPEPNQPAPDGDAAARAAAPVVQPAPDSEPDVRVPPPPATPTPVPQTLQAEDPAAVALGIRAGIWHLLQGKVVGADLRLADGTLLARAGEPITPELVDRAQRAGLITDLILDMTFAPGGGN